MRNPHDGPKTVARESPTARSSALIVDDMKQHRTVVITLLTGIICAAAWYLLAQQDKPYKTTNPGSVTSSTDTVVGEGDGSPEARPDLRTIEAEGTATTGRRSAGTEGEPASTTAGSPDVEPQAISQEEILQLRNHLELLYATADREALLLGYKEAMQRLPDSFATEAHTRKLASGEYTMVGQASPSRSDGDDTVRVPKASGGAREAFGLVRIHRLESGEMVETRIELEELGDDAVTAVEVAWFQSNIGRRK